MDKSPYVLLVESLKKNELDKYLIGAEGYNFVEKLVEYPTNLAIVFSLGLNEYCRKFGKESLNSDINKALIKLLKTPIGCWWVITVIYDYLFGFLPNKLLFRIDIELLVNEINRVLLGNKQALINTKEYVGYRFEHGLWSDIENMSIKINDTLSGDIKINIDK